MPFFRLVWVFLPPFFFCFCFFSFFVSLFMNSVLNCLLPMQTQPCCWRSVALRAHSSASWRQRWCSRWLNGCWIKPEIFEVLCVLEFKAQTLGEKKKSWLFCLVFFFVFSNSVLRMICFISWKGRKILCFIPALCEHLLAYTYNRATCVQTCVCLLAITSAALAN